VTIDFSNLGFDDFRRMALDNTLSQNEKIGFPDSYRQGFEERIFEDINKKLTNLDLRKKTILDIGPGCGPLAHLLLEKGKNREHHLILVDSEEMLSQLPDNNNNKKVAGHFPECKENLQTYVNGVDAILCYSVLHYIFNESSLFKFIDTSMELLSPGGQMLIGDIPNISKRKRFFSSQPGIRFHQNFTATEEIPSVSFTTIEPGKIDDSVILSIIMRVRAQGCDAYWVPQSPQLPMANRREDILILKP
jgi:cyclopropane fatty-acyl-phospholipid synthase-like methyltransferase